MSYRYCIGSFPKSKVEKYQNKTGEEIAKEFGDSDGYFLYASPDELNELEYLGDLKYNRENWKDFYSFDIKDYGYDFYILEKEDLIAIIKLVEKEVSNYYEEKYKCLEQEPEEIVKDLAPMVFSKKNEWSTEFCENLILDKNEMCSTQSGHYEYMIFNLIAILKMFDWENDYLIFNGW